MKKLCLLFALLTSCSSLGDLNPNSPEGAFQLAERYEKAERYEEAVIRYSEVRSKFPYSKYATESQLRIADIEFKREYYIEAASAYQIFREVNPRYERLEYVIYRSGLSFYMQLPEINARDLSAATQTLRYFDEYLRKYPQGQWVNEVRKKQAIVYQKLADKEMYIGNYYFKQKQYFSALGRYKGVANNYTFLPIAKKASLKAVKSAINLDYKDVAKEYIQFLGKKFPASAEYREAINLGEKHGIL